MKIAHTLCVLSLICSTAIAAAEPAATSKIVAATNTFLSTLDAKQRQTVLFAFDDEKQRQRWSNLPTGFVPRGGISLKDMNAAQRAAALAVVSSALSPRGYEKVQQIMQGDEVIKNSDGGRRPPGGNAMFGQDLYYISILGTPSEKTPWMLQFGGHHLALNITIAREQGILTPTLTGAQPVLFTLNGKTVRPLGQESDKALALLNALDTKRALLLDVISEWTGIIHQSAAAARMSEVKAGLTDTWFAWSGPTTAAPGSNITAYYRIQGPHLVIEYAPQTLGGDPALHVHTMYRDPTNDYGKKFTAK